MLMKEVDTFFVFLPKDGVPQSIFVHECFVYMYLQTNIHKHLQTSECVFCQRFIAPLPLTTQQQAIFL